MSKYWILAEVTEREASNRTKIGKRNLYRIGQKTLTYVSYPNNLYMLNSTTYTTRVQKFKMKFFIIITFLISKGKRCHPCTQDIYNRYPKIKHEKYNTLLISIKYRIKFKHEMSISSKHKAVTSDLSACTSIVERSINFFSETLFFFFLIGNKNFFDKKSTMSLR